ncbi:MAG: TetR/AcrR family transcriptional regulator [Thermodesulfobacteriota bacterium]|nr:TetR/AcrR family transcriptional regulator [Thermodesulfobacteriota bacterium]
MAVQSTETRAFLQLDQEKQRRIVEASIEEFAEKGYEKASMNIVVKRAGISKGALFNYFVNKSGLFGFIYLLILNQVKDYLRTVRDESRDEDFFLRMEKVMRAGVDFVRRYPGPAQVYYRIIFTGDAPFKDEILKELHGESLKFIQSLVEDGVNRGDLRPDLDTKATAFVLECVLDRFLQAHHLKFLNHSLQLYGAYGEESHLWIQKILELFRTGLINTLDNANVEEEE